MIGFIGRRLLELLPVVLIASMAIFGMIYAIPGGPVAGIVGDRYVASTTRRRTAICTVSPDTRDVTRCAEPSVW